MKNIMKNPFLVAIIAVVIVSVGAFYGGLAYGQGKQPKNNFPAGQFAANMERGGGKRLPAGGLISGAILAKDDQSMTVKLADGGSKIIFFSLGTKILKSVEGSVADLQIDSNVTVNGQTNADGSVVAEMIQLRQDLGFWGNASGTPNGQRGGNRPNQP